MSAERLGRPGSRLARENLCVLPRIAYNATAGVQPTGRKASRAVSGGLLTWAAKPKVRESPKPRKFFVKKLRPASPPHCLLPTTTEAPHRKFRGVRSCR